MFLFRNLLPLSALLSLTFLANQACAGITLSSTRLVFDGKYKEAAITVRNDGEDALIQSWIDSNSPDLSSVPFAVTPPIARVGTNEHQMLRVLYEGQGMPTDQETVVWLNVQEIPQSPTTPNTLQLAVRQRIKVFFRPKGLSGDSYLAPIELSWRLTERAGQMLLTIKNPTKYHVTIASINLQSGTFSEKPFQTTMIAPKEEQVFPLSKVGIRSANITFSAINDYGAQDQYTAEISTDTDTKASPIRK